MKLLRATVASLILAGLALFLNPGAAQAAAGPMYMNYSSSLCIAVAGGSTALNANIVQYTCDGNDRSLWDWVDSGISYNGTHFYFLKNRHSGWCISTAGGSTAIWAPMVQYHCDANYARLWVKQKFSGDIEGFFLVNVNSSFCLGVDNDSTSLNARLVQAPCTLSFARDWEIWPGHLG